MKRLGSLLRASLLAGLLATPPLSGAVIPVYDLDGLLSEGGQGSASLLSLDFSGERPLTHFDLMRSLRMAADDEEVKGVVFEIDGAGFSFAQIQELLRLARAIREQGKDLWLYTESLGRATALLGSVANHFVVMPQGEVDLTGLYGENLYFKGLFDTLGITADVVHIGDFKSAGESYYRDGPSEASREQMNALLDAGFEQTVAAIAEGRGITPEAVRAFIDRGLQTPALAREAGLVDDLQDRTDFIRTVRAHYGEDSTFDRHYELPNLAGPEFDSMLDVFNFLFSSGKPVRFRNDYLAVVVLDADITDATIAPVRREVLAAAKNDKCRGLVLRVNSPGGAARASEVLWEATEEFKATGKPFAVSMGGVAASGGYYVSAGADRIFAEAGTVTGSIGVIGMKIALGDGMAKLGISSHEMKRGRHADLMNSNRPFSPDERELVRQSMLEIYGTFKQRILDGRGDRLKGDLDAMAGGRVHIGTRALELGLVDELGGLHESISWVAAQAKVDRYDLHLLPQPQDLLSGLLARPPSSADDELIRSTPVQDSPADSLRAYLHAQPVVRILDPSKRAALTRFAAQLEAFQHERILLLAPAFATLHFSN